MAPPKLKPPPVSALQTSNTDPPESLLWAYQLRREHGYLLSRVDAVEASNKELTSEYKNIMASNKELVVSNDEIRALNGELSSSLRTVTEQNRSFGDKIQEIENTFQALSNKILRLSAAASCDPGQAIRDLREVVDKERRECVSLKTSLDELQADWKTDKEERVRDIEALRETIGDLRKIRELEAKVAAKTVEGKENTGAFNAPSVRQLKISTVTPTPVPEQQQKSKTRAEFQLKPISKPEAHPLPRLRKPRLAVQPIPAPPLQQLATYVEASSLFQPEPPILDTDILNGILQGDMDIEAYLKETEIKIEMLKRSPKPENAEQRVVNAFLEGLDRNKRLQSSMRLQLHRTKFAWSELEKIVGKIAAKERWAKENPKKEVEPKITKGDFEDHKSNGQDYEKPVEKLVVGMVREKNKEGTRLWTEQRKPRDTRNEIQVQSEEIKRKSDVLLEILEPDSGITTRSRKKKALNTAG